MIRSSCFPTSITRRTTISSMRSEEREGRKKKHEERGFLFRNRGYISKAIPIFATTSRRDYKNRGEANRETGIEIRGAIIPELIGEDLWPRGKDGKTIQGGGGGRSAEVKKRRSREWPRASERASEGKRTSRCRKRGEFELNLSRGS